MDLIVLKAPFGLVLLFFLDPSLCFICLHILRPFLVAPSSVCTMCQPRAPLKVYFSCFFSELRPCVTCQNCAPLRILSPLFHHQAFPMCHVASFCRHLLADTIVKPWDRTAPRVISVGTSIAKEGRMKGKPHPCAMCPNQIWGWLTCVFKRFLLLSFLGPHPSFTEGHALFEGTKCHVSESFCCVSFGESLWATHPVLGDIFCYFLLGSGRIYIYYFDSLGKG